MATVNFASISIEPEEIVDSLKREVRLKDVCHKIICQQIIYRAAQARGVTVTSDEIQAEADRQRYQKRLESAASTLAWLADQLITPNEWEAGICDRLLSQKLAKFLFTEQVEKYFAEHRLDFEQISLYKITVPYQQLAQELLYQIEENETSFYEVAHLYDLDAKRRSQCGYAGKLYRWSLEPDIAAVVFSAKIGEVVGPFQHEQGYDLLMVEEFNTAELTSEIRQEIIDRLFKEWLDSELNYLIHNQ